MNLERLQTITPLKPGTAILKWDSKPTTLQKYNKPYESARRGCEWLKTAVRQAHNLLL